MRTEAHAHASRLGSLIERSDLFYFFEAITSYLKSSISDFEIVRDCENLHLAVLDSPEISAGLMTFADRSGLVLVHRGLDRWLNLLGLARYAFLPEDRPPAPWKRFREKRNATATSPAEAMLRAWIINERFWDGVGYEKASLIPRSQIVDWKDETILDQFVAAKCFMLAHEAAHFVLGHSEGNVFLRKHSPPLVEHKAENETAADALAVKIVVGYLKEHKTTVSQEDWSYQQAAALAWRGISLGVAAMMMWEYGFFLRSGATHPGSLKRIIQIEAVLAKRPYRCGGGIDNFTLNVMQAGFVLDPVDATSWARLASLHEQTGITLQLLEDIQSLDLLICNRFGPRWDIYEADGLPTWVKEPPDSAATYLSRLGLKQYQCDHMLDAKRGLAWSTAVNYTARSFLISGTENSRVLSLGIVNHLRDHLAGFIR
jgi:hypothetical protein